jgi:HK97 gp10 family phage protein
MFSSRVIRKTARDYPQIVADIVPGFLEEAGTVVKTEAKRLVPVDIGNLKGSINHRREGYQAIVGSNAEYAEDVEYGTGPHYIGAPVNIRGVGWRYIKNHPGTKEQPYMRPAIDENRKKLIRRFAELLRSSIRGRA